MSCADSSDPPLLTRVTATFNVLSLNGSLTRVTVSPGDASLLSLFQSATATATATATESALLAPHLRLCYDRTGREPDILSVINADVLGAVSVRQFLDRQQQQQQQGTADDGRFSIMVQLSLRCLCRLEPIPCVTSHSSTIGSVQQQFLTAWRLRHQLPFDAYASRTLRFYKDESRATEWESVNPESPFLSAWLHNGAQSPLPVRVQDGDGIQGNEAKETADRITVQLTTGTEEGNAIIIATLTDTIRHLITIAPFDRPIQHITHPTHHPTPLPDHTTLHNLHHTTPLLILPTTLYSDHADITVHIRQLNGLVSGVAVRPRHRVGVLRRRVAEGMGIGCEQVRLVFGGRQLEDGRMLVECGIVDQSIVHLVLKLC